MHLFQQKRVSECFRQLLYTCYSVCQNDSYIGLYGITWTCKYQACPLLDNFFLSFLHQRTLHHQYLIIIYQFPFSIFFGQPIRLPRTAIMKAATTLWWAGSIAHRWPTTPNIGIRPARNVSYFPGGHLRVHKSDHSNLRRYTL